MNAVAEPVTTTTRVVPLVEAVELNPRPDRSALPDALEVSFVPMAAVAAATGRMDATATRLFGEVKKGYTVFREGDVLFAKITPCMENGKMAVARGLRNGVGCGSTEFHVLRPRPGVDPQYVYHFVSSARFRAEAAHHMTGAVGQKRVPVAFLETCEIPLPDLGEQRRIVAELEKQFSRLDEAVANLKRVKANLDRYAASVLDATTAGGLLEESVERPRSWQQTTLGAMADVIDPNPSHRMPSYVVEGYPLISSENFVGSEGIDFTKGKKVAEEALRKQRELFRIESGDFALSRIGTIGKTRFLPMDRAYCLSHALVVIQVKEQAVDKRWLRYAVSSNRVLSQARSGVQSVGVPDLGMGKIRAFKTPLPPLEVQQLIASEVDRRLSIVREVEAEVDANLKRAQALRQAVLARAFAGANEAVPSSA